MSGGRDENKEASDAHPVAPPASDCDFCSIADLVKMLRSRKISAAELLEHVIARVEVVNPRLNAIVVRDFDSARTAARAADEALARGDRKALLGIPVTLKEPF